MEQLQHITDRDIIPAMSTSTLLVGAISRVCCAVLRCAAQLAPSVSLLRSKGLIMEGTLLGTTRG